MQQEVKARARSRGYLQTLSGRRRWLPGISSANYEARGHAERVAVNSTCQGSAADIVKGAMVQLLADLRAAGLSRHCRMLVQVHDELLFEVSACHLGRVVGMVRGAMEGAGVAWGLRLPLPVKISVGPSWGQLTRLPAPSTQ